TVHRALHALERRVVGATGGRVADPAQADLAARLARQRLQVADQRVLAGRERARAEGLDPAGPVVLVEAGMDARHHLRVVGDPRPRAVEALLLAAPVADDDRPLRVRVDRLEDPGRLEHGQRAGAVVGGARTAVPRVIVRREDDVLVRL